MDVIKNYEACKDAIFNEGDTTLRFEDGCLLVADRKMDHSSVGVHVTKLLGDKIAYKSTWLVKVKDGGSSMRIKPFHKVVMEYLDVAESTYFSGDLYEINDSEWTEMTVSTTLPEECRLIDVISYFYHFGGKREDLLVKKLEIEETEPERLADRMRNYSRISLQDKTLVGTIRWDAFTESEPDGILPPSQVARVLSHKEYHNQAPFFSLVDGETISFPEYTLDIWEKEADFAIKGGLDYFAYLWYETDAVMSEPRKMHLKSPNKDKILMCGILEHVRKPETMAELYEAIKDSCYLRLDGRPVVFLYGTDRWKRDEIKKVCDGAVAAGITEPLYLVGMSLTYNPYQFMVNYSKGIDAVSWYSVGATEKAMPFEKLKNSCETSMVKIGELCEKTGIDIIPAFTAGRDTRARIRTGVSWCAGDPNATNDADKPYRNMYALPPTNQELEDHMRYTVRYVEDNPHVARPRLVCSYGWNEHEEGGWLCPTLKVDENNIVVRDEDGNILPDTIRLDILRKVVDEELK